MPAVLIYAGIDEAGYGPTLGPLCVALTVFEVGGWRPPDPAPDLWARYGPVVCRRARDAAGGTRVAVDDSKALKLHRSGPRGPHALTYLERGVLAFLGAQGHAPENDAALLGLLGAAPDRAPGWYAGGETALPLATTSDHLRLLASRLAAQGEAEGVRPVLIRCRALDEAQFNQRLARTGSKARVSLGIVRAMVLRLWERFGVSADENEAARVIIDRQGGRVRYGAALAGLAPGVEVRRLEETTRASRYELVGRAGSVFAGRRMIVAFLVEAESQHFPVALASMTAKLVRELWMARFNAYWSGRIAELKPTAGYATDARRWLRDAHDHLSVDERATLVRRA